MRDGPCGQHFGKVEVPAPLCGSIIESADERAQFTLGRPGRPIVFGENGVSQVLAGIEQLANFGKNVSPIEVLARFEQVDLFVANSRLFRET
jgi:hypothetical protein